jgi:hypothetical protein
MCSMAQGLACHQPARACCVAAKLACDGHHSVAACSTRFLCAGAHMHRFAHVKTVCAQRPCLPRRAGAGASASSSAALQRVRTRCWHKDSASTQASAASVSSATRYMPCGTQQATGSRQQGLMQHTPHTNNSTVHDAHATGVSLSARITPHRGRFAGSHLTPFFPLPCCLSVCVCVHSMSHRWVCLCADPDCTPLG